MRRFGIGLIAACVFFAGVTAASAQQTVADLAAAIAAATRADAPAIDVPPKAMHATATPAPPPEVRLPVPTVTIYPNDKISEDMIEDRAFAPSAVARYPIATSRQPLLGKVAKRMLLPGNPIPLTAVGIPQVVTRGVATRVHFEMGGLSMTTLATPMDSGGAGELIRLKNVDSGQVITGVIQPDGTVKVGS